MNLLTFYIAAGILFFIIIMWVIIMLKKNQ